MRFDCLPANKIVGARAAREAEAVGTASRTGPLVMQILPLKFQYDHFSPFYYFY